MSDRYDIADPDDPNTLRVPFMWVPQGCEPDPEWLRANPGWVRIPAAMVPRDPRPGESATQWNVQLNFPDETAAFELATAVASPPAQPAASPAVDWSTPAAKAAYEAYVTGGDPIAVWRQMNAVLDNPVRAIGIGLRFGDRKAKSAAPDASATVSPASGVVPVADTRNGASQPSSRPGRLVQDDPTDPVLLVDDQGKPVLTSEGKTILFPAGLDPHFFVRKGLEDKKFMDELAQHGGEGGPFPAQAYMIAELAKFRREGPWDAQRIGGKYHKEYVDYATVAIGLYAAAAGIPRDLTLEVEDRVARRSEFAPNTQKDKKYIHLPKTNLENTDTGYGLYESGGIKGAPSP